MPDQTAADNALAAAVVASSPDAIIAADLDRKIIAWNAAAAQMMGIAADRALGTDLLTIVPAAERAEAAALLDRARRGETISETEVERLRADGSTVVGRLTLGPIRDPNGAIRGTVGIMHDITERRSLEDLVRRNERLASIGTLVAGIAHELNNPVGGVLMAAQYARSARDRVDSAAIVDKALADIEADAKRCSDIVRGLLRFAREEKAERADHDPNLLIAAAIDLAQKSLPGVAVDVSFDPTPGVLPVHANDIELRQALVNLIMNALQSGGRNVAVSATSTADGALQLIVEDNGGGIPDEVIDHLFDPFFTTRRQDGAAGLGLSLAHAIITSHDGSLHVASAPSQGTTVTLRIPGTTVDT